MNSTAIHYINIFLGLGAILLQIFSIGSLFLLFFGPQNKNIFFDFIKKHFLIIGFLVSFFSSIFSLLYSEVIGFPPCQLCWFQRVFIFPQVFIFGVALWQSYREKLSEIKNVIKYSTPLILVGFVISIYQNFIYYFGNSANVACDISGISCYQRLVSEFGGYISIPMLALSSFLALLALVLVAHFYQKE